MVALPLADAVQVQLFSERHSGDGSAFLVLGAFLLSFLFIRTSARMTRSVSWWPGGVETDGGVHLHHLVWGICLLMLCGFLSFAGVYDSPWWHLIAIGFGIGVGFTLDEFALWIHLDDVYWSEEGRTSFDAVICACTFAGLVVIGTEPFGLDEPASVLGTAAIVTVVLVLSLLAFAKGRVWLGAAGLFIPLFSIVGALRLAHPKSPWAQWRYSGEKLARSRARFADDRPMTRFRLKLNDLIAGAPDDERPARD